jgi:hypothetical protein
MLGGELSETKLSCAPLRCMSDKRCAHPALRRARLANNRKALALENSTAYAGLLLQFLDHLPSNASFLETTIIDRNRSSNFTQWPHQVIAMPELLSGAPD